MGLKIFNFENIEYDDRIVDMMETFANIADDQLINEIIILIANALTNYPYIDLYLYMFKNYDLIIIADEQIDKFVYHLLLIDRYNSIVFYAYREILTK